MKTKNLFVTLGLALALGVGVGFGLTAKQEVKGARAYVTTESWGDTMFIRGGMNGWGATQLTLNPSTSRYEVAFTAQNPGMTFKISKTASSWEIGSTWLQGNGFSQTNFLDYVQASGDDIALIEAGEYVLYWNKGATADNVCADIGFERSEIASYEPHTYSLTGTFNNWDQTDTTYDLALSNGNKTATITLDLVSGQQFKIVEDHAWGTSYGFSNGTTVSSEFVDKDGNFYVKTSGNYTITLDTNENYQMTTLVLAKNSQLPYKTYSLAGSWTGGGWDPLSTDYVFVASNDGKTHTLSGFSLEIGVQFKIVGDHAWGGDIGYNADYCTAVSYAFGNQSGNFEVLVEGNFTITITLNNEYAISSVVFTNADTYTLKVGDAAPVALTHSSGSEYSATGLTLNGGELISYAVNGVTVNDSTAKLVGNNNLKANKTVLAAATNAEVYVDVVAKTIWVGGLPLGGYHIYKNYATDKEVVEMTHGDEFDGFDQYYSASLSFEIGDTIEFLDTNGASTLPVIFHITTINTGGLGDKFELDGDVITCVEATTTAVYMKLKSGLDEVYFGNVTEDVAAATAFAEDFNSKIGGICKLDGSTNQGNLEAEWSTQAGNYSALTEEAKARLAEGSSSSVEQIRTFDAKYESVYRLRKLGSGWNLADFLNKGLSSNSHITIGEMYNKTTMLIVVISVSTVIAATALFLLCKKRTY